MALQVAAPDHPRHRRRPTPLDRSRAGLRALGNVSTNLPRRTSFAVWRKIIGAWPMPPRGWADVGVCLRLTREEAGLRFFSLREDYFDFCFPPRSNSSLIQALLRVVRSPEYRRSYPTCPAMRRRRRAKSSAPPETRSPGKCRKQDLLPRGFPATSLLPASLHCPGRPLRKLSTSVGSRSRRFRRRTRSDFRSWFSRSRQRSCNRRSSHFTPDRTIALVVLSPGGRSCAPDRRGAAPDPTTLIVDVAQAATWRPWPTIIAAWASTPRWKPSTPPAAGSRRCGSSRTRRRPEEAARPCSVDGRHVAEFRALRVARRGSPGACS